MRTPLETRFLLPLLIAVSGLILAGPMKAQTFTTLYSFGDSGGSPYASLILSSNTLYGTTSRAAGQGTVFAVNTDGTSFTTVYSFIGSDDGAYLYYGLVLSSNVLYGTAKAGGNSGNGTVFAVNTDGSGFTNLHSFAAASSIPPYTNSDGAYPSAVLLLAGKTLYGTTRYGGSGAGTVFAVNTDGTDFMNLHIFTAFNNNTNSDG